jgi:hypothetical protein
MATGRLGIADVAATTNTTLYTVPVSTFSVVTVNLVNRGAGAVTIRIAIASTASPANGEYIEYGVSLGANSVLERTGLVLAAGQNIIVYASAVNISAVAYGIETATS